MKLKIPLFDRPVKEFEPEPRATTRKPVIKIEEKKRLATQAKKVKVDTSHGKPPADKMQGDL